MRLQVGIRMVLLAFGLAGTVALTACTTTGLPASSHHVVSTTVPAPPGQVAAPGAANASDPIDSTAATEVYGQIQSDVSSVDSDLSQVGSDLSNPEGDS